jgi:hypothetical protein
LPCQRPDVGAPTRFSSNAWSTIQTEIVITGDSDGSELSIPLVESTWVAEFEVLSICS